MKLQEYQAKQLLRERGVTVPPGGVADTPEAAARIAAEIGFPVAIKAQVRVAGRGKAGGIRFAANADEAAAGAGKILGMDIKGLPVRRVLIEPKTPMDRELYLSIVFDRDLPGYSLLLSGEGGVDIEETAARHPDKVITIGSDAAGGIEESRIRAALPRLHLSAAFEDALVALVGQLFQLAVAKDLLMLEINPLGLGPDGRLLIVDAKIIADDNGLFRHADLQAFETDDPELPVELSARQAGLSYVKLDGDVGCIVNGAGLAMATMDAIQHHGGRPANFLDVGGSSSPDKARYAMNLVVSDPDVKSIVVNIFGGITRCDDVARGLIEAVRTLAPRQPLFVRLAGTNEAKARKLLEEAGIASTTIMDDAVRQAVRAAGGPPTGNG